MLIKEINPDRQSYNLDPQLCYGNPDTRNVIVKDKGTLSSIVDEPCLRACEYLYDCNILTLNSSANKQDSIGFITLDYKTLSQDNKRVYHQLLEEGILQESSLDERDGLVDVNICIPITSETTVLEFSDRMLGIVSLFHHQDILYGFITEDDLRKEIAKKIEDNSLIDSTTYAQDFVIDGIVKNRIPQSPRGDIDINGTLYLFDDFVHYILNSKVVLNQYYYDDKEKKYWIHEDLYKKHISFLRSKKVVSKLLPQGNSFDIDALITNVEERVNLSGHRFGTSDCFDLGDYVLLRYCQKNDNGFAREEAEFDMDEINKMALLGVNTPKHYIVKRDTLGDSNFCYVIQDKVKGKCCEDLSVDEILSIPQIHYDKFAYDFHMLKKYGIDPKLHNYYYDVETGFWFIDLNPGFAYRYGREFLDSNMFDCIPSFAIRMDIMFSSSSREIDKIERAKQNIAYDKLIEMMSKSSNKGGIKK